MSVYWGGGGVNTINTVIVLKLCVYICCVCVCVCGILQEHNTINIVIVLKVILCIFVYRNTITSILLLYSVFSLSQLPIISFLLSSSSFLVASCCPCTPDFIGF